MGHVTSFDWDVPGGGWVALVLGLAFLGVLAWTWRDTWAVASPARRRWLAILRGLTALGAFLAASQPTWTGAKVQTTRGRLAVIVDESRSMAVTHGDGSRAAEIKAFAAAHPELEDKDVALFMIATGTRTESPNQLRAHFAPEGTDSNLREGIAALVQGSGNEAIGSVLLVSDGADRSSSMDLSALTAAGVKVHTALVGGDLPLTDDTILFAKGDAVAFVRQEARVLVRVRSSRAGVTSMPVELRQDGHPIASTEVALGKGGEGETELRFTPTRVGRAAYQVLIPTPADDDIPENNVASFLVTVRRDKLRVLHVAGRPAWDQRFMRAFLKRDPTIDLVSFFILRTDTDLAMAATDEMALIPFPTDELFSEHLDSFDVVIFQNFNYGPYDMARYLPRIRDYVEQGGGFVMVGGDLSFSAGGYAGTALGEVLPVVLPPTSGLPNDTVTLGTFQPVVDRELMRHPLIAMRPDPTANLAAWQALAPLEGANEFRGARDGALVLLRHPTADGGDMPLLVVGEAGKGRTLALGTDASWRWGITTGGETGDASAYNGFWDRALRWLVRDPTFEPANMSTDRDRVAPGERVAVRGVARDGKFVPMAGRALPLSVVDVDGKPVGEPWTVTPDARGNFASNLSAPGAPGLYRLRLGAEGSDATATPLAEELFVVTAGAGEMLDARVNGKFLRLLSEGTGGTAFASWKDVPKLQRLDATRERIVGQTQTKPFASWWFIAALLGLFGVEWLLRRRWGRR